MKKFLFLFIVIIFSTNSSFAESFDSQLYLYCNHSGVEKCKYDMLLKQSLIINDLKLTNEQRKEMDNVFNIYSNAKALIANEIKQHESNLANLKENKTSLKLKLQERKKIRQLNQSLDKLDRTIKTEVKKVLTPSQKHKYDVIEKSLF